MITYDSEFVLEKDKIYPAYTVAELGEMLLNIVHEYSVYIFPKEFKLFNGNDEFGSSEARTEADLRAWMLLRAMSCSKK